MSELRIGGGAGSYPALGVNVPQPQPGMGLSSLGQFAQIQNALNQNMMFQQSWKARAGAGEILAQHPGNPEAAVQEMFGRPDIAPWAPQIANDIMQYRNTTATYQGQIQTQVNNATEAFMKNIPALYGHPENWNVITQMAKSSSTPEAWPRVQQTLQSLYQSLFQQHNADGSTRMVTPDEYMSNAQALMVSHLPAEQYANLVGRPEFADTGAQKIPYLAMPGVRPGEGRSAFGSPLGMGIPGGVMDVGGTPTARPAITGTGQSLGPGAAMSGAAPGMGMPAGGGMVNPMTTSPRIGTSNLVPGAPLLTPMQSKGAVDAMDEWMGPGLKAFQNNQAAMGTLTQMNAAFDNLAAGDQGLVGLGSGAEQRLAIGKGINTIYRMFGGDPPIDETKVAEAQELIKDTKRMGIQVLTNAFGGAKEAASTIQNITKAVPDIENTYFGGKLIMNGLQSMVQRALDQRYFENQWQMRNAGNLTGAAEAFNAQYPAQDYINRARAELGLLPNGNFANQKALETAVIMRYLTPKQASAIHKQQFGTQLQGVVPQQ